MIGPTAWGGSDRDFLYNDLVWTGVSGEKFMKMKMEKFCMKHKRIMELKRVNLFNNS